MTSWKIYKLRDVVQFNPTERIARGTLAKKVSMDKLIPYCREVSGYNLESFTGGMKFRNGDTIMARITPCLENGKTSYVSFLEENEIGFGSTEYIVFRAIKDVTDSKFIYYFVTNPTFRSIAIKSMVGSSGRQRVQQSVLEELEISLPGLEEQRRIAGILGAIDDKIENNRRINTNLELQAQALFDEWFITNTSRLGVFSKAYLTDIANYLNGLAMQRFRPLEGEIGIPVLKIKELGQGQCDSSSDLCSPSIEEKYIVRDGDIIFSWSGTLLVDIWCGGVCGLNQHLFKVTSDKYPQWFIYYWTKHHLAKFIRIAKDKAVTMGHIKRGDLEASEVIIPSAQILDKMDNIIAPIFDAIISRQIENRTLATLRDTLLPKLMNGEIKISEL